ncbi:MAG TPA: DUF4837 family protein [Gemmatimonadota bacterium]|nr:DUF4837 family protein [Gemmatimonadota bacterium]
MSRFRTALPTALVALATLATGCTKGPAYGSANAIIAVVHPAVSDEVEPILRRALEREIRTTRPERIFEITFTTPEAIGDFRHWGRVIVVEPLESASLVPELVDVSEGTDRVVERIEDRWARGQTIHVLAARGPAETVRLVESLADSLFEEIHAAYVGHQIDRMWASGRDSTLFHSMLDEFGFGIVLPRVYRPAPGSAPPDSRVWYNDDPRRIVSVHWTALPAEVTADTVLALRRAWGAEIFLGEVIAGTLPGAPDDTAAAAGASAPVAGADPVAEGAADAPAAEPIEVSRVRLNGREAIRLQGVWHDATDAGVFVLHGVACGDRLVLLDGNLFAPDREKYPFVLQFDQIFQTFHCADVGA